MRGREQSLDILRGIGIFLMVFDHVGWGSVVHTYIQSFHMPLFFIVSGYLWKKEDTLTLVKKRLKALMIPYAFFATLYICSVFTASFLFSKVFPSLNDGIHFMNSLKAVLFYPTDMGNMPVAPALWFLPCMFFASIAYSILSNLEFNLKAGVIVSIFVLGMTFSTLSDIMLPFTIEPLAAALGFMLMGEIVYKNRDKIMEMLDKSWIIISLLITEAIMAMANGSVDMRSARYQNCVLYVVNSLAGTMAYWGVARKIFVVETKIPLEGIQRLSFLSQNAMGYICFNQLFIMVIGKVIQTFMPKGTVALIASKSVTFIVTMIAVSWITRLIKGSRLKIILGGK